MRIRFQADADLNQAIRQGLIRRELTADFQTAHEAGLAGLSDPEVLAKASRGHRILVNHDHKTMPKHFGEFVHKNQSAGVIIIPQHLPVSLAIEELLLIWSVTDAEEWVNRICYLPL